MSSPIKGSAPVTKSHSEEAKPAQLPANPVQSPIETAQKTIQETNSPPFELEEYDYTPLTQQQLDEMGFDLMSLRDQPTKLFFVKPR